MKYKNIKTGAVIDSSSNIIGESWKLIDELEKVKQEDKYVEEEINLEEMTNKELEEFAKEQDINLTTSDKQNKETRIKAIAKAFE